MNQERRSFIFDTELRLIQLTGLKAHNLSELRELLVSVPRSSIFFHTHQQYLAHNFRRPVYYNDFAVWVSQALREEALAEKLAAIDLLAFTTMRSLRTTIVENNRLLRRGQQLASSRMPSERGLSLLPFQELCAADRNRGR